MSPFPPSKSQDQYEDALQFLYDRINYEKLVSGASRYPFRLRRMVELLSRLGLSHFLDPVFLEPAQDSLIGGIPAEARRPVPLVHIAGTKGKGSTATMVSAALTCAGVKTGTYTSPHLHRLEERFRVDGQPCSPTQLVQLVDRVRSIAEPMAAEAIGSPTFFELTTAIALLHFDTAGCQAVVLEVGLGGRLDSTNVCRPNVSVVTSIGLDHQHVLGDTKEAIAAEKAGIAKKGVPMICGATQAGPSRVIQETAATHSATVYQLGRDFTATHSPSDDWGSHQGRNAAVAIATLQILQQQTAIRVSEPSIRQSLADLQCDGRIERYHLPGDITVLVDAAHNEDSISALCDSVRLRCRPQSNTDSDAVVPAAQIPIVFVFGTSIDKVAEPMIQQITGLADTLMLTRFTGNPRFTDPEKLRPLVPSTWRGDLRLDCDPLSACRAVVKQAKPGTTIVVCGSFFLAAETRLWFAQQSID